MRNVDALDLNLLKAFSALYAQRNVTRAAATIGLAQPSMSNALARLRAVLDDALFVKSPQGMIPTARAEALAPKVDAALGLISEAFETPATFDPKTAKATIRIAAPDNLVMRLAPLLAAHLAAEAPLFDLRFAGFHKDTIYGALDRGEVDIALARFSDIPARFHQRDWLGDSFVVVARKGHFDEERPLTLDRYCDANHLLVSFRPDGRGAIDDVLNSLGRTRRVALVVSQFAVVPDIVARSGVLATIPASVADGLAERAGCDLHALPFAQDGWTNQAIWSAQTNADAAKRFAVEAMLGLSDRGP
ncbi:LysR substrate-binding domain-containing protein [Tateyamaria armeniaca]|uniref:LysR substrate-binding domain-containing protein n=1 Tax=Tateyamaria armeniaca TaxID=2518930 RepID=A0ABW8UNF7_9RHOB